MTRQEQALKALNDVMDIIYDTVLMCGDNGAPSGHVYSVLMTVGVSLDMYNLMIAKMVKEGRLTQSNFLLHAVVKEKVA